jgi:hypothetical protein
MDFAAVRDNVERVRGEIAAVQHEEGLTGDVRLIAVTKGHGPEAVRLAARAGVLDVGENRVQEALAKQDASTDVPVRWHLIGHLQTNKAKFVAGRFAMVHSIDSLRAAGALDGAIGRSVEAGKRTPVLLQVNVAGETQKNGCEPDEADAIRDGVSGMVHLDLVGLMTMAPFTDDVATQRRAFAGLRTLRDRLSTAATPLTELSMGMSGDYRAAVAEGATMVRLGTVLFGART